MKADRPVKIRVKHFAIIFEGDAETGGRLLAAVSKALSETKEVHQTLQGSDTAERLILKRSTRPPRPRKVRAR